MSTDATHTQSYKVRRKPPPSLEQYPNNGGAIGVHKRAESASAIAFELYPDLPASPTESIRKAKYGVGQHGQGHYTVRRRTLSTMSTPSLIRDLSDSSSSTSFSTTSKSGASSIASMGSIGVLVPSLSSRRVSIQQLLPPAPVQDHTSTSSKHKLRFLGIAISSRKSVDNEAISHADIGTKSRKGGKSLSVSASDISSPAVSNTNVAALPRQTHVLPSGYTSEPEPNADLQPIRKPWMSSIPRKRSSLSLVTNGSIGVGLSSLNLTTTFATATTTTATTMTTNASTNMKTKTSSLPSTITPTSWTSSRADQKKTAPLTRAVNAKTNDEIEGGMYTSPRPAPVPASDTSSSFHSRSSSSSHSHSYSTSTSATSYKSTSHKSFKFSHTPSPVPVSVPEPVSVTATGLVRNGNVSTSSAKTNSSVNTNTSTTTNISHTRKKFFDHVPIFRRRRKEETASGEEARKGRGGEKDEDKVGVVNVQDKEKLWQMVRSSGEKPKEVAEAKEKEVKKEVTAKVDQRDWTHELQFGDGEGHESVFGVHKQDSYVKPKAILSPSSISASNSNSSSDWKSYLDLDLDLGLPESEGKTGTETTSANQTWHQDSYGVNERGLGFDTEYGYGYEAFRRGGRLDLGFGPGLDAVEEVESRCASEDAQVKCEWGPDVGLGELLGTGCMRDLKLEGEGEGKTQVVVDECARVHDSEEEELLREEELMKELMSLRKKRKGRRERMTGVGVEVEVKTVHRDDRYSGLSESS